MGMGDAAIWGVVGGITSGLVSLMTAITAAGFEWPWRNRPHQMWPRLCVYLIGLVLGGVVAAPMHDQMSGVWPAFVMGVTAPVMIRRLIAGIEVPEGSSGVVGEPALGADSPPVLAGETALGAAGDGAGDGGE